jgi:uncharacterized protein YyaL (SSP411 family)
MLAACVACTVTPSSPEGTPNPAPAADDAEASPAVVRTPGRAPDVVRREGNHLVGEPSPYLQQHAHNPVDWYPWGPEALERAKREHKPIFLSIGYSTCHWCHVMEKESFEDDEVARLLNEHFIAIKVDRERRPDVDAVYIDAVSTLGGSTGWPLTVFLTPDLEPFFGGTYYPRVAKQGRPGFLDILDRVRTQFEADPSAVATRGRDVLAQVERQAAAASREPGGLGVGLLDDAMARLASARDTTLGGFGQRQKFPNAPLLLAELRHYRRTGNADSRDHLVLTLKEMMRGGVRDHLGGGFHRYAVDPKWHIPHFEKTLYDNGQLAGLYIEAGRTLDRADFVQVGRQVLDELIERWQQPDGGFVVGFDADDPEGEGAYYSWTPAELGDALGPEDAAIVAAAFGVTPTGDRELEGRSVLHRLPDEEVAGTLGLDASAVHDAITRARPKLRSIRATRPPPGVDDKELVGWNALAVMSLADAGRWLDEPRYVQAAVAAGSFIATQGWTDGRMLRGRRQGQPLAEGVLEDYALAGLAYVRLHAATSDPVWLARAVEVMAVIRTRFYDEARHVFLRTPATAADLPVRLADLDDGVLPSGGSAATLLALELGAITGDTTLYELGYDTLSRTAAAAATNPFRAGYSLVALDHATAPVREVVIAGDASDPTTVALRRLVAQTNHARILPVLLDATGVPPSLSAGFPALQGKKAIGDRPTAYVCERGRCERPTSDPAQLHKQLSAALSSDAIAPR